MGWKARTAVQERKAFLEECARGELSMAELCRRYGISRKTGYKWRQRLAREGECGLADRSRAPKQQPRAVGPQRREQIVNVRRSHATWGPRKILAYLRQQAPEQDWPAHSTIGALLQREGLVARRRSRRHAVPNASPLEHATECNKVWSIDFKGWFRLGDGERCDPVTIQDAFSRMVLRVRDVSRADTAHVQAIVQTVFSEHGLPAAIRTDNGAPFASHAPGGLSRLSMGWIRLGIHHERIEPGCPEQNGRHERMHLTLLQDTADPPAAHRAAQQERFARFEQCFNFERPHEALGNKTPGSIYVSSTRLLPSRAAELRYPEDYLVRRVQHHGDIKVDGERTFLSEILAREWIGLRPVEEQLHEVYWSHVLLGWYDSRSHCFVPVKRPPRHRDSDS